MVKVEVIRGSDLNRQRWTFIVLMGLHHARLPVVLDGYARENRATKRHKWHPDVVYQRLHDRWAESIGPDRVPLPDDVRQDAIRMICEKIDILSPGQKAD